MAQGKHTLIQVSQYSVSPAIGLADRDCVVSASVVVPGNRRDTGIGSTFEKDS